MLMRPILWSLPFSRRQLSAVLVAGVAALSTPVLGGDLPIRPDPTMTPGAVLTTDLSLICQPGYTKTVRNVPSAVKAEVFREYGIARHTPSEFEVDHLISLELGGSNDIKNLWPESYRTMPLNAHVKDQLENRLHQMVCRREIPIERAQQEIATDWIAAAVKYKVISKELATR